MVFSPQTLVVVHGVLAHHWQISCGHLVVAIGCCMVHVCLFHGLSLEISFRLRYKNGLVKFYCDAHGV